MKDRSGPMWGHWDTELLSDKRTTVKTSVRVKAGAGSPAQIDRSTGRGKREEEGEKERKSEGNFSESMGAPGPRHSVVGPPGY